MDVSFVREEMLEMSLPLITSTSMLTISVVSDSKKIRKKFGSFVRQKAKVPF
jgi:hypothetical protein